MFNFLSFFKFLNNPGWAVGITIASIVVIAMVKVGTNPSSQTPFASSTPAVNIQLPERPSERYWALVNIGTGFVASYASGESIW